MLLISHKIDTGPVKHSFVFFYRSSKNQSPHSFFPFGLGVGALSSFSKRPTGERIGG